MARRAVPYGVTFNPQPVLPTDTPTWNTRRRYGDNPALRAIITAGNLHAVIRQPTHPSAGQGAEFPGFPKARPSNVAPDAIGAVIMTTLNLFSPIFHSKLNMTSTIVPTGGPNGSFDTTVGPHSLTPPRKALHGTGGKGIIAFPPNFPNWPDFMSRLQR
jgi:hypothetical protein